MNYVSSVNLKPCCASMLENDIKLRDNSKQGTKKTCPTCKSVNQLIGSTWVRPVTENAELNRFPIDEEKIKQGHVSAGDPQVEEFEAGEALRVSTAAKIESVEGKE